MIQDRLFAYDASNNLIYFGKADAHQTDQATGVFNIWKLSYTDGELSYVEGPLRGTWDGRADLDWA